MVIAISMSFYVVFLFVLFVCFCFLFFSVLFLAKVAALVPVPEFTKFTKEFVFGSSSLGADVP